MKLSLIKIIPFETSPHDFIALLSKGINNVGADYWFLFFCFQISAMAKLFRFCREIGVGARVGRYPYSALNLDWAPRTRPVKHWRSISCARVPDLWSNDTLKSLFTHFLIPFLLYYSFLNKRSSKVQSHLWAPSDLSTKTWNVFVSRREVFISYRAGNGYLLLWSTLVEIYWFWPGNSFSWGLWYKVN